MDEYKYNKNKTSQDDVVNNLSRYFEKEVSKISNKINFSPSNMYYIVLNNSLDNIKNKEDLSPYKLFNINEIQKTYDYHETVDAINLLYNKNLISNEIRNNLIKNYIVDKITSDFSDLMRQYLNKALEGEEWK